MTHYNITNNTKFNVRGITDRDSYQTHEFTVKDLREFPTQWQGDTSYYGSKRTVILNKEGKSDLHEWDDAILINDGDKLWIDGACYIAIIKDPRASDGVAFITEETFKYIQRTIKNIEGK
jgi:hypothetical protein